VIGSVGHFNQSMPRIDKLLSQKYVWNVISSLCYTQKCCQHFLGEKTTLLREEFWVLSFEEHKMYGMDIPRRLHVKIDMK
jgi:hypothetical protein